MNAEISKTIKDTTLGFRMQILGFLRRTTLVSITLKPA